MKEEIVSRPITITTSANYRFGLHTSRVYISVFNDSRILIYVIYLDIGSTKTVTDKVATCARERASEREKERFGNERERDRKRRNPEGYIAKRKKRHECLIEREKEEIKVLLRAFLSIIYDKS